MPAPAGRLPLRPRLRRGHRRDPVLVASNGGAARHPQWYLNLRAEPRAEVAIGRRQRRVRAEPVEGDERDALLTRAAEVYPPYADYQWRSDRTLPVLVLRPHDPPLPAVDEHVITVATPREAVWEALRAVGRQTSGAGPGAAPVAAAPAAPHPANTQPTPEA